MHEYGDAQTFSRMQRETQLALHLPQMVSHKKLILAQIYSLHGKPDIS
jgi:hypothetical protein